MSILDSAPHTATIYPAETVLDSRNNTVKRPSTTGTVINCLIVPVRSDRDADGDVHADYKLIARETNLDIFSRVEWNNRTFFVLDGPHTFSASETTTHISAIIREER